MVKIDDVPRVRIVRTPKLNSRKRVRAMQRISVLARIVLQARHLINPVLLDITARDLKILPPATPVSLLPKLFIFIDTIIQFVPFFRLFRLKIKV